MDKAREVAHCTKAAHFSSWTLKVQNITLTVPYILSVHPGSVATVVHSKALVIHFME